ncbi:endonuclease/exonuclease/phosphatase family protein [Marivita sp. GX14005]|uniref:endonuclease/exonuclease/phosphatase family protein n=1 Tax=Marivita sp. GX14005 TaxID=2942276 RepID=UPI0020189D75|nr:endonuclease/exonuclease/phosphatase family protein [Marivita sp. GX14005]MCL3883461.1 endonuclease/exonuclease/phosphatase family protein [Marivita sp. GX14005]
MDRKGRGMVKAGRRWLWGISLLLGALFVGSFAGAAHPAGDMLAAFRIPIALIFALWVIWSPWPYWLRWSAAVLCLAAMGQIVAQSFVAHPPGPVTVYQKNLRFGNDGTEALAEDIRASGADIVALQEVTSRNAALLRDLRADFPYQTSCALTDWARVAVLSRWPAEGEICVTGYGVSGLQVASPGGTFWAISLHGFWPWPYDQPEQMQQILPILAGLDEPAVIAGDFNMVPWSHALRRLAALTGTSRAGALFSSFRTFGMPLPIDHVYAPGGGSAEPRGRLGSDHAGILARVVVFE